MSVLELTDKNFESEVKQNDVPVLVDFWAEWCGPCKMISPIVDEISEEMEGKLKVCKVNVDDAQQIAASFNVMSIPTLIIFKNGEPVDSIVGAQSKDNLLEKINAHI